VLGGPHLPFPCFPFPLVSTAPTGTNFSFFLSLSALCSVLFPPFYLILPTLSCPFPATKRPLKSPYRVWGSVVSSHYKVWNGTPAKNSFLYVYSLKRPLLGADNSFPMTANSIYYPKKFYKKLRRYWRFIFASTH